MKTRFYYITNPENFSKEEEKELIEDCTQNIDNAKEFYKDWNVDMAYFSMKLDRVCIRLYEKRNGVRIWKKK